MQSRPNLRRGTIASRSDGRGQDPGPATPNPAAERVSPGVGKAGSRKEDPKFATVSGLAGLGAEPDREVLALASEGAELIVEGI